MEKKVIYCGGVLIVIILHPFGKGYTVDQETIIRLNSNIAANPKEYTVMSGIHLHPNTLADPNTIKVIALSIEGCICAIFITKKGRNSLELTIVRTVNFNLTLNRK